MNMLQGQAKAGRNAADLPALFLHIDRNSRIVDASQTACEQYGYDLLSLQALELSALQTDEGRAGWRTLWQQLTATAISQWEGWQQRQDGSRFWAACTLEWREHYGIVIVQDQTKRRQEEEELRYLLRAVEQSPSTVVITDTAGLIEYVNPKFSRLTGYAPEEVLGKNPRILKSGEQDERFYQTMWQTITRGEEWRGEFHNKKKNGELYWEFASISPLRNAEGCITHFLAVKEDTTARKAAEEAVQQAERQLRQELLAAGQLQQGLLPAPLQTAWLQMMTLFRPYQMVSGDVYDFALWDNQVLQGYLGDVMGHGVEAALQTSALRVLGQSVLQTGATLPAALAAINRNMGRCWAEDSYAAMIAFAVNRQTERLTVAAAGINHIIFVRQGQAQLVSMPGPYVGMLPDCLYEAQEWPFSAGDAVFFLSDGLLDILREKEELPGTYAGVTAWLHEQAASGACLDDATAIGIYWQETAAGKEG